MSAIEGSIRRCDHPDCTASYDAAAVMDGTASAAGWTQLLSRGEHYCPAHQDSPVLAAYRRLFSRHGTYWNRALADLQGRWPREDLMDLLTAAPTSSGVWQRLAVEALAAIDAEPAGRVRIEWGHRLPLDMPGRERYTDADRVHRCHGDDRTPDPGVPCEQTHTYRGDPLEHVWRLVPAAGGWRTGTPPEEPAETPEAGR